MRMVHLPDYDKLPQELLDTDIFVGYSLRAKQLQDAKKLKWLHSTAAGVAQLMYPELRDSGIVVTNPLPSDEQLDPDLHARVLADGLAGLARDGVTGKAVTPYLLAYFHEATGGASLDVNVRIIMRNAALAAQIAVAHAALPLLE